MTAVRMADLPVTETDVLVVGAGPTGLMAGLVLARRGVPVVVVDQKAGPTRATGERL
jgi:2-polyprenyl-6-methoxyphenol hydroxylase-like FAD-dependent oxidoreductase